MTDYPESGPVQPQNPIDEAIERGNPDEIKKLIAGQRHGLEHLGMDPSGLNEVGYWQRIEQLEQVLRNLSDESQQV